MTRPPSTDCPDLGLFRIDHKLWQEGDDCEWQKFYTRFQPDLEGVFKVAGAGDDAEDLVHETLFRSFKSRLSFDPEKSPRAWLRGIARNVLYDWFEKRRREGSQFMGDVDTIATKQDVAHELETSDQVKKGMAAMRPNDREAFCLRANGLTHEEAASLRGTSTAAQKVASSRAAKSARDALKKSDE